MTHTTTMRCHYALWPNTLYQWADRESTTQPWCKICHNSTTCYRHECIFVKGNTHHFTSPTSIAPQTISCAFSCHLVVLAPSWKWLQWRLRGRKQEAFGIINRAGLLRDCMRDQEPLWSNGIHCWSIRLALSGIHWGKCICCTDSTRHVVRIWCPPHVRIIHLLWTLLEESDRECWTSW